MTVAEEKTAGSKQYNTCRVGAVGDDGKEVLEDVGEVHLVEALRCSFLLGDVLQQGVHDVQAGVSHIAHGMLECPDNRVQDQLELSWRYIQQRWPKNKTNLINTACQHTHNIVKSTTTATIRK